MGKSWKIIPSCANKNLVFLRFKSYLDPKSIPKTPNLRRYDWIPRVFAVFFLNHQENHRMPSVAKLRMVPSIWSHRPPQGSPMKPRKAGAWRIILVTKWLVTMVSKSPKDRVVGPLPNGRTSWLINGSY